MFSNFLCLETFKIFFFKLKWCLLFSLQFLAPSQAATDHRDEDAGQMWRSRKIQILILIMVADAQVYYNRNAEVANLDSRRKIKQLLVIGTGFGNLSRLIKS